MQENVCRDAVLADFGTIWLRKFSVIFPAPLVAGCVFLHGPGNRGGQPFVSEELVEDFLLPGGDLLRVFSTEKNPAVTVILELGNVPVRYTREFRVLDGCSQAGDGGVVEEFLRGFEFGESHRDLHGEEQYRPRCGRHRTPGLSGAGPSVLKCKQKPPSRVHSRPLVRLWHMTSVGLWKCQGQIRT